MNVGSILADYPRRALLPRLAREDAG